ncbi:hypothetical protein Pst134EA_007871 [Puccinia striiformis f. sp. tritici]|uniref:hypothetical protein n=1 Tax=Puccinia striiformis f. sp. tritici TaxID=168172 RepID=UPI002008DB32|nr:hypothetical protein Pst134EA_007871 [Puccinia striiformis f. sp. tritici]KAH9470624.1 hypothetical protein Pst134EA_007871 [Puccinia striiformis f. sp. tritici]
MSSLCSTTSGRTLRVLLLVATTDMKVFTPIFASSAVENFTSSFYAILCPLSAISATGIVPRPGLWEEQSNHFPFSDVSSVATSSLAPTELDGIWKTTQSQANLPLEPAYEPIVQSPGVKVSEGYQTDPLIRRVVSSSPEGIPMTDQPTHTRKRKYNHGPLCINEPIVHSTFPSPFQSVDHCYPVPHDGIYLGQASSRGGFHAGNSNIAPHQIFGTGSASSQSSDFVPGVTPQTAGRSHVNPVDSLTLDTHNFDWSHLDAFLSNDFVSELHQCDEYHIPSKKPRIASGHVDVDCPSNRLLFHSQLPIAIYLGEHGDSQVTLNVLSRSGLTLKALDTLETQLKALTEWIVGFHVQNARNVNLSRANHRINLKPFFTWLKNQIFTPEVGFPVMGVFQSPWHGWEEQFQNYKFHETQLRLLEYFSDDKDPSSLGVYLMKIYYQKYSFMNASTSVGELCGPSVNHHSQATQPPGQILISQSKEIVMTSYFKERLSFISSLFKIPEISQPIMSILSRSHPSYSVLRSIEAEHFKKEIQLVLSKAFESPLRRQHEKLPIALFPHNQICLFTEVDGTPKTSRGRRTFFPAIKQLAKTLDTLHVYLLKRLKLTIGEIIMRREALVRWYYKEIIQPTKSLPVIGTIQGERQYLQWYQLALDFIPLFGPVQLSLIEFLSHAGRSHYPNIEHTASFILANWYLSEHPNDFKLFIQE